MKNSINLTVYYSRRIMVKLISLYDGISCIVVDDIYFFFGFRWMSFQWNQLADNVVGQSGIHCLITFAKTERGYVKGLLICLT